MADTDFGLNKLFLKADNTAHGIYFGSTVNTPAGDFSLTTGAENTTKLFSSSTDIVLGNNTTFATLTSKGTNNLVLNTNEGTNSGTITLTDGVDGNITLDPNGSGKVDITGTLEFDGLVGTSGSTITGFVDEDNMASDSATLVPTQQSVKAYVDANAGVTVDDSTADNNFAVVFHDGSNGLLDDDGTLTYNPSSGTFTVPTLTVGTALTFGTALGDQVLNIASHDLADGGLQLAGTLVTASAVELNVLDASISTATDGQVLTFTSGGGNSIHFADASGASEINDLSDAKVDTGGSNNNIFLGHTATGIQAGAAKNIGVGITALDAITSGSKNTCVGEQSGTAITTGGDNSCLGYQAGTAIIEASFNTCIGSQAGNEITSGANNTFLGYDADGVATADNQTAIGSGASCSAANQITLGNNSVDDLRCADTSIASLSDRRDKTDIVDSPYGLDFINTVRPVQFTWATREGIPTKAGKQRLGFIAQELQEAMPNNQNDILNLVLDADPDKLEAKYGNLLPIMVKAIQELSAEVTSLRAQVSSQ